MNDKLRFALTTTIASVFPLLELSGVVSLSGDQVAAIMAFIGNALGVVMLVWKAGQGVDPGAMKTAAEGAAVAAAVATENVTTPEVPLSDRRGD
jgi:hypothetical protein